MHRGLCARLESRFPPSAPWKEEANRRRHPLTAALALSGAQTQGANVNKYELDYIRRYIERQQMARVESGSQRAMERRSESTTTSINSYVYAYIDKQQISPIQLSVGQTLVLIRRASLGGNYLNKLEIPTSHFIGRAVAKHGLDPLPGQPASTLICGVTTAVNPGPTSIEVQFGPPRPSSTPYAPVKINVEIAAKTQADIETQTELPVVFFDIDPDRPPSPVKLKLGQTLVLIRRNSMGGAFVNKLDVPAVYFTKQPLKNHGLSPLQNQPLKTTICAVVTASCAGSAFVSVQLAPPSPTSQPYPPQSFQFDIS
jgi:hypothetical protein